MSVRDSFDLPLKIMSNLNCPTRVQLWKECFTVLIQLVFVSMATSITGCGDGAKRAPKNASTSQSDKEKSANEDQPHLWVVLRDGSKTMHANENVYQLSYEVVQGKPTDCWLLLNAAHRRFLVPVDFQQKGTVQVRVKSEDPWSSQATWATIVQKRVGDQDGNYVDRSGMFFLQPSASESSRNPIDCAKPLPPPPKVWPWFTLSDFRSERYGIYHLRYQIAQGEPQFGFWVIESDEGIVSHHVTLKESGEISIRVINEFGPASPSTRSYFTTIPPSSIGPRDEPRLSGAISLGGPTTTAIPAKRPAPKAAVPPAPITVVEQAVPVGDPKGSARLTNHVFESLDPDHDRVIVAADGQTAVAFIAQFDRNKDGQLNESEIQEQIARAANPKVKLLTVLEFTVLDKNRDGRITIDDDPDRSRKHLLAIRRSDPDGDDVLTWEQIDPATKFAIPAGGFSKTDANKDGVLTPDEFTMSPAVFQIYDADNDGKLTPREAALKSD